ncbi:MAG: hypothetical protein PEGG_00467 [Paraeggerthella hongkongensis]|uniref:lipoprotein intramolecular transacylase Lit n=1 Tax=Paraeggerthella TaxID=651554 RepID=UPI001C100399|nr:MULTISPECIES: DUF1461 domain-containing protein [Paraeggerthella]MBU5404636.1 DUF1461 domain-containing protein [Paraeggerthella hongkongensis]MCD2432331.1 DUF1461 domain-containing protein [Paraeggerthella hominis]
MPSHETRRGAKHGLAQGIAAIALAVTFVAAGLGACCLPQTTGMLAGMFSGADNPSTPFSHDDLVQAAVATRDYTVGSNDREAVFAMLRDVNRNAQTPYAEADETALAAAPDAYTLNPEALSHLDDVHRVIAAAGVAFAAVALAAVAFCVYLGIRAGKRAVGGALACAGIVVLAVFAALSAWVVVDFNGFFAAFHSLFFADGTWTFSYESLLITMYPPAFWMGMGAVWLTVTGALSLIAAFTGTALRRRSLPR